MLLIVGAGSGCPTADAETLADPTRPPASTAGDVTGAARQPSKWHLTATIIGPRRRVAVINGKAVRAGERIDHAVLLAIEPGSALLRDGERRIHLKLDTPTVKQKPKAVP